MTDRPLRVVIDTNVLLSFLIKRDSVPGAVAAHVIKQHRLLLSAPVLRELDDKCKKQKFRPYFRLDEGLEFVELLERVGEYVVIQRSTAACRDAKDNMFLELALSSGADLLVSGDKDLSDLKRIEGIPILPPRDASRFLGLRGCEQFDLRGL